MQIQSMRKGLNRVSTLFLYEDEVGKAPVKNHHPLTQKQRRELNWKRAGQTDLLSVGQLITLQDLDKETQEWRIQTGRDWNE